tara:strand:+ start:2026 stop:6117 length:4092 start_codon:yes stop_codon:yes gene_type:complete
MARKVDPKDFIRNEEQLNQIYVERGKLLHKNSEQLARQLETQLQAAQVEASTEGDQRKRGKIQRTVLELEEKANEARAIANELAQRNTTLKRDQVKTLGDEQTIRKKIQDSETEFFKQEARRPKVYGDMAKKLQIAAQFSSKMEIQEELMGNLTAKRREELEGVSDTIDGVQKIQQQVAGSMKSRRKFLAEALGFETEIVPYEEELRNLANEIALAKQLGNTEDEKKLILAQKGLEAASKAEQMEVRREKLSKDILNTMEQQTGAAGQIFSTLKNIVTNPLTLMTGLLAVGLKRYETMRQRGVQLAEEQDRVNKALAGQGVYQERNLALAKQMQDRFRASGEGFASSLEGAAEMTAALSDQLGSVYNVSGKLVDSATKLRLGIGLSAEDSAKVMDNMMLMTGFSEDTAANMIQSTYAMTDMYGLNAQLVFQDIANASTETRTMFGGTADNVRNAAIEARRMGISMDDMAKVAKGLLDFESSIEAEMEAQLLTGKNINLQKARELAMSGDALGASQEVLKQMGGIEEFNKMNIFQKEAMAKAAGLELGEMEKMLKGNETKKGQEDEAAKRKGKETKLIDQQVKVMGQLETGLSVMEKIAIRIGDIFLKVFGGDIKDLEKGFMNFINSEQFEVGLTHFLETIRTIIKTVISGVKSAIKFLNDSPIGAFMKSALKLVGGGNATKGFVNVLMAGFAAKKVVGMFGPLIKGLFPGKIGSLFEGLGGGFFARGSKINPMNVTTDGGFGAGGKGGSKGFGRLLKAFQKGGLKGSGKAASRMIKGGRIGQFGSMLAGGKTASLGGTALGGAGVVGGALGLGAAAYMSAKDLNDAGTATSGQKKAAAVTGASGAATGALAGAAIGSAIPIVGTLLGAGIGALVGYAAGKMAGKLTIFENDVDAAARIAQEQADKLAMSSSVTDQMLASMKFEARGNAEELAKLEDISRAMTETSAELNAAIEERTNSEKLQAEAAKADAFLQETIAGNRSMWGDDEVAMLSGLGMSSDLMEKQMTDFANSTGKDKATMAEFFNQNEAAKNQYFAQLFDKTGVTDIQEQEQIMARAMAEFGDTTFRASDPLDGFGDFMTDMTTDMVGQQQVRADLAAASASFEKDLIEQEKQRLLASGLQDGKEMREKLKAFAESKNVHDQVMDFEEEKLAELEYANMSFGEKMMDWLGGIGEWFSGIGTAIGEWFSKGWTMVKEKFNAFGEKIKAWPGKMWDKLKLGFDGLVDKIKGLGKMIKAYMAYPFNVEIKRASGDWLPSINHLGWKGLGYTPDDMFMPGEDPPAGYGDRTIMTEEGAFALNNKDSIIAGTDLGQGGSNGGESTRMANAIEILVKQNQMLIELVAQGRVIEMDGAAVGKAVGLASIRA